MRTWVISMLAAGTLLTAALPVAAQTRPHVFHLESSRSTGPTCVVDGDASACGESSMGGPMLVLPGPVMSSPIIVGVAPILGPVMGGGSGGHASKDTDVDRSSHHGAAITR